MSAQHCMWIGILVLPTLQFTKSVRGLEFLMSFSPLHHAVLLNRCVNSSAKCAHTFVCQDLLCVTFIFPFLFYQLNDMRRLAAKHRYACSTHTFSFLLVGWIWLNLLEFDFEGDSKLPTTWKNKGKLWEKNWKKKGSKRGWFDREKEAKGKAFKGNRLRRKKSNHRKLREEDWSGRV